MSLSSTTAFSATGMTRMVQDERFRRQGRRTTQASLPINLLKSTCVSQNAKLGFQSSVFASCIRFHSFLSAKRLLKLPTAANPSIQGAYPKQLLRSNTACTGLPAVSLLPAKSSHFRGAQTPFEYPTKTVPFRAKLGSPWNPGLMKVPSPCLEGREPNISMPSALSTQYLVLALSSTFTGNRSIFFAKPEDFAPPVSRLPEA